MAISGMYMQSFAAYKMKLKRLINDLTNDLGNICALLEPLNICNKGKKCMQFISNRNKKQLKENVVKIISSIELHTTA